MIDIIYYILEALKFLCIYIIGFRMPITEKWIKRTLLPIMTIITGVVMNYGRESDWFPVLYLIFVFALTWLCIAEHTWKNVILALWSVATIFSVDTIGYTLLKIISNIFSISFGNWNDVIGSIFTIGILYTLFRKIGKTSKTSLKEISPWYYVVFLLVCVVNAFVLAIMEMYFSLVNKEYAIVYLLLIISSLSQMAFVLMLAASNNWHRRSEELKERYLELQKDHYQYLNEKNIETKKFRHDMRAHVFIMQQYVKEENWHDLEEYMDTIYGKLEYIPGYLSVQNGIVDAILNYYRVRFQKIGCEFQVKGNMPDDCKIGAFDLCTIFSNIFSNAFEAVENAEDKVVELFLGHEGEQIFIREMNTYAHDIKRSGSKLLTNKKDKEYHGFGMDNIAEIVKKYCGDINFETQDKKFILEISMNSEMPREGK